jgi:hypothetical protein
VRTKALTFAAAVIALVTGAYPSRAADLTPTAIQALPVPPTWTFRATPYGWFTSLRGNQTVRGRTVDVNVSFIDVVEATLGRGGQLFALMANFEARNGRLALFADAIWEQLGTSGGVAGIRPRRFVTTAVEASAGIKFRMGIAEVGAAYEIAQFGMPFGDVVRVPAALDILAGGRLWYQQLGLSFDLNTSVDVADLVVLGRNRALAASGSVTWLDPFIGARVRFAVAPGQEVSLRGDVGGFGAGSRISWHGMAGYNFELASWRDIVFSALVGYRALYVDRSQGRGRNRYQFDMLQHGPVLGVSMRW